MATIEQYLNLITSAWRQKPKFTAMVSADVAPMVQVQNLLESMIPKFDVDLAVGDQLDIIGQWVGITRNVNLPTAGVYFSWDSSTTDGWDYGYWEPSNPPTNITVLPDSAYRTLIKAKIAANQWNGTIEGAYAIWDALFTNITILIQDFQDMSYNLAIVGGVVDSITLALITGGYIPLRPEGVKVNEYYVAIDSGPVFAWDLDAPLLKGWDEGSWVQEITPT